MKEVNRILTEISKTADHLSKADLTDMESSAFSTAGKYGQKASQYLTGVQEMALAGYGNAEELAELSTLAQTAGGMDAGLARDYLLAMDAAYQLKGSVEALTAVLDGQNHITAQNALSMKDLAQATKLTASLSADSGVSIEQSTAALGTMIAVTRQGGDDVVKAWKGILMNLQQVIDAVGGKDSGNQLRALLENWTLYEKMLEDYASGSGSAMEMAMRSADSWEGSLNRLNNTFTKVVHNFVNSDFVVAMTNGFNGVLSVVDKITSKLGSFGSITTSLAGYLGAKGHGLA